MICHFGSHPEPLLEDVRENPNCGQLPWPRLTFPGGNLRHSGRNDDSEGGLLLPGSGR